MQRIEGAAHNNYYPVCLALFTCLYFPLSAFGLGTILGLAVLFGLWVACSILYGDTMEIGRESVPLFVILAGMCGFFILPNAYRSMNKTLLVANMALCTLYALSGRPDEESLRRVSFVFRAAAALFSAYIIFCGVFRGVFVTYVLPRMFWRNAQAVLRNFSEGYGIWIGGSSIYADYIIGIAAFFTVARMQCFPQDSHRIRSFVLLGMYLLAILLEGRRGQAITIAVTLVAVYMGSGREIAKKTAVLIVIGAAGFVALAFLSEMGYVSRLTRLVRSVDSGITSTGALNSLSSGRIDLWTIAWDMFVKEPVVGNGFGTFVLNIPPSDVENVHNTYLQFLCETGIVGFGLIMVPQIYLFFKSYGVLRAVRHLDDGAAAARMSILASLGIQMFFPDGALRRPGLLPVLLLPAVHTGVHAVQVCAAVAARQRRGRGPRAGGGAGPEQVQVYPVRSRGERVGTERYGR